MAQFTYSDYNSVVERAQNGSGNSVKVGFFKLANNGDEALVRINCSSVEDLQFATVHQLGANTKWMKVSCINEVGSYDSKCPLCKAVAEGNTAIGKAAKKVFVEMLVSYKDRVSGQWSAPVPVIWERPAGFSREIATKLQNYGDLKANLFKITRNGAAGDRKTTYSFDYAVPTVYKPEMIPADFSAFGGNFKISKHSYWEKTVEEIETFLRTGSFPEVKKETINETVNTTTAYTAPATPVTPAYQAPVTPAYQAPVTPAYQAPATQVYGTPAAPAANTYQAPVTPTPAVNTYQAPATPASAAPTTNTNTPNRNFNGGFTF